MFDPFEEELQARLASCEVALGNALRAELERGLMTAEQFDWVLDFFAELDQVDEEEALARLESWFAWRDMTHPDRHDRPAVHLDGTVRVHGEIVGSVFEWAKATKGMEESS